MRGGYLHAHASVLDVFADQMRDWTPAVAAQPDDYLDCAAGAISAEPVRIGKIVATDQEARMRLNWTASSQDVEVQVDDWRTAAAERASYYER